MGRSLPASNPSQVKGLRTSPSKKTSPRGFSLNKPPLIHLGGGRIKRQGKHGIEEERNIQGVEVSKDRGFLGDLISITPELNEDSSGILAHTRRCRLILETDYDDDAVEIDKVPKATDMGPARKNPSKRERSGLGRTVVHQGTWKTVVETAQLHGASPLMETLRPTRCRIHPVLSNTWPSPIKGGSCGKPMALWGGAVS
ncbi:unnamed protein product [Linum trigynum]|uniref:Uncharacterized protein n=1 Tax=Linum trigynum TaxID=586398 RepID=A0AAV2DZQ9_9ROSI